MQDTDTPRQLRRAVVASVVGTSIEWYDFFLYGSAAALVFPKLFFPKSAPLTGALLSFATYAVGFAARPVGAWIFGSYGDRIGRKATLIVTLLTMGIATALIGVLPTYSSIGIWGGIILTVLRVFQGIGVGGEWGGSVLLAMEWGSNRRRGLVASWPQMGVPIGLILGNGALLIFSNVTGSAFLEWGWRIPFLLSFVLVAVGLYIRLGVMETPLFRKLVAEKRVEPRPFTTVVRRNWREILLAMFVRTSEQAPFYILTAFVLVYGTEQLKLGKNFMLFCVFFAACLSLLTIPLAGMASDRFGRRPVYMVGVILIGLVAFPYFALLNTGVAALVVIAVVVSLIPHDIQYGPQAALIAESFTGRLRYSGASMGYQLASLTAGGPAPLIATKLLSVYHSSTPIALYIVGCSVVSLVALLFMKERSQVDHTVEYDSQPSGLGAGSPTVGAPVGR
ncbi:MAG: MHS family MFS transporter [Candidatus Dormibacteraeota bacterium]|uniref:MHS family MFS transporter n=1 Tax=Candidatus Amunia macphersoniae TaxID=3127014 RepID=A0A934KLU0_9BACT|nr:MHS family MFS transporter [Candidatus Dormibacteraeota bacterium]